VKNRMVFYNCFGLLRTIIAVDEHSLVHTYDNKAEERSIKQTIKIIVSAPLQRLFVL
jgi:hypothetical protein